jgi:arginine decarboxylase
MAEWSIEQARELYNIAHWSDGYFDINEQGDLVAYPDGSRDRSPISLTELTKSISEAGLTFPVLVRFNDILKHRFDQLRQAFNTVIAEASYRGQYVGVYPIKVNQQRRVVTEILRHGGAYVGLESGSKPELMAVLALSIKSNSVIVCNGYKDNEYIRLALIGQMLGHRVYIVLEKLSELDIVLEEAKKLGIKPKLGIRVRLATIGTGKWQETSGEKSKFGFYAAQVLYVLQRLRDCDALDTLQLLHFHLGSQIANINDIQRGLRECARFFAELHMQGAAIEFVDVGGGLGVDYEGTHTRSSCSMNYTMQEYANNIIYTFRDVCDQNQLPHPNIITESGRAMTAHHALLITNIIGSESASQIGSPKSVPPQDPQVIKDMWYGYENLSKRTAVESYHDVCHWMNEAHSMFTYDILSLEERARAEQIYLMTCVRVRELLNPSVRAHWEIINELNEKLADKYFCNFSVFQSIPDSWAIDQVFPILPISGLDQEPTCRVILQDLTCDSDGRIDIYVDGEGTESTLPLLPFNDEKPYLLGIFLVGAYQEILGDMHNLFGDTDSIHVELLPEGGYQLVQPVQGDTVSTVLRYVHFDPEEILQSYRQQFRQSNLNPEQSKQFLAELTEGLHGYTYLEKE